MISCVDQEKSFVTCKPEDKFPCDIAYESLGFGVSFPQGMRLLNYFHAQL